MPYKKKSRKAQVTDAAPDTPPMITSSPVKQEEGSAAVAPNLPTAQTGAPPLPAETAPVQASAAPQDAKDYEEIDSLGFITIGSHTVASPFTCYCCTDVVLKNQQNAETHLASQEHHLAHEAFLVAEGGGMSQEDVAFVKAFDRFVEPRPAASKLAILRASVSTQKPPTRGLVSANSTAPPPPLRFAAAPGSLPSASDAPPQPPASPAAGGAKITKAPSTPTPKPETPARLTRQSSGARQRVHHGEGSKEDQALVQQCLENDLEGKASPARPSNGAARTFEGPIPWYDYVCGRTLSTMEEAQQHFAQRDHRAATDAFLAANWDLLQENDPASLRVLLTTIKARNNPSGFAERLAASCRKAIEGGTPAGNPASPEPKVGADLMGAEAEFARQLKDFGQSRTLVEREKNPTAKVFMIGVEETLKWRGRFHEIPTPAYCTLCKIQIPYEHHATAHCESKGHRVECEKAADALLAKLLLARASKEEEDSRKVTFSTGTGRKRERDEKGARDQTKKRKEDLYDAPSRPRSTMPSPKTAPTTEYHCVGARCTGRFSVPSGEVGAVGKCQTCRFEQKAVKQVRG